MNDQSIFLHIFHLVPQDSTHCHSVITPLQDTSKQMDIKRHTATMFKGLLIPDLLTLRSSSVVILGSFSKENVDVGDLPDWGLV